MHCLAGLEESGHQRERSHGKTLRAASNWEPEKAECFLRLEDLTELSAVSNRTSLEADLSPANPRGEPNPGQHPDGSLTEDPAEPGMGSRPTGTVRW